jgi:LysM repeat protein
MGSIPAQTTLASKQTSYRIAGTLIGSYTIQSGDSFSAVADRLGLDLNALLAANPGVDPQNLQVGQVINLPSKSTGLVFNLNDVARVLGVSVQDLQSLNPGISNNLTVGETIKAPGAPSGGQPGGGSGDLPGGTGGSSGGGGYVNYSGPASNFPDPSQWASYTALWSSNSRLMKFNDSDSEIALIKKSIEQVARESGVDVRVILCIVMQESGGNVRIPTTDNGVRNPGLMQSHNGVAFNPSDPAGSILQMIRDGTEGTKDGDGLKQNFQHQGNWYAAFREYNSGSVNVQDLNDPQGATGSYVRDAANRLMGHIWDGM